MKVGLTMEGDTLRTRLTGRTGVVQCHEKDGGVQVLWNDGKPSTHLHPEIEVDIVPGVFQRRDV